MFCQFDDFYLMFEQKLITFSRILREKEDLNRDNQTTES